MIKLRKTVIIGAIYDDSVRAGDVYTVLDNRGRDQHIVLIGNKIEHDRFHLFFIHLPVSDGDAARRHETFDQRRDRLDRFNAIMNEEDLTAARQLEIDGRLDHGIR